MSVFRATDPQVEAARERLARRLAAARGETPADLLIAGARLLNVFTGQIEEPANYAIHDGVFLGPGDYEARQTIQAEGRYLAPGLMDAHLHLESSLLAPREFARLVAARGTAAAVCDPHEIANVLGREGIEYFLSETEQLPVSFYFMVPSCVPATHMETAGARLDAAQIAELLHHHPHRMPGLAEFMNFPGLVAGAPEALEKILAARTNPPQPLRVRPIDGHAPGLSGQALNAYILAGPASDHECTDAAEAREKLGRGMQIFLREGTTEHNLADLLEVVTDASWMHCSLCCDDRLVDDIVERGHMDHVVREAIRLGCPPVRAVAMAGLTTARYFGLSYRGAVAPGYRADALLLDDLETFEISTVLLGGRPPEAYSFGPPVSAPPPSAMHVGRLFVDTFRIPLGKGRMRVIGLTPGQIVTRQELLEPTVSPVGNLAVADPARDLAKLAVIERHRPKESRLADVGLGFVTGLGLVRGAVAGSVAHDSHNLIVAGMDDSDMLAAARKVVEMEGGFAVAEGGRVLAALPLPLAGLMSDRPVAEVRAGLAGISRAMTQLMAEPQTEAEDGAARPVSSPLALLSFLALPVIPELKLTDKGLVDVSRFEIVDLFTG